MKYIESKAFVDLLKELPENVEACALYSELAPSRFFIQLLMQEKVAFKAQMKVSTSEDPVLAIFAELLYCKIESESSESHFPLVQSYLRFLGRDYSLEKISALVGQFSLAVGSLGLYEVHFSRT